MTNRCALVGERPALLGGEITWTRYRNRRALRHLKQAWGDKLEVGSEDSLFFCDPDAPAALGSIISSLLRVGEAPLNVGAAGNRPVFPPDRDVEDHVFCLFEFPAPGYKADHPVDSLKKIGVAYASINGNGFGGYGETVFGTEGTLVLEREQEALLYRTSNTLSKVKLAKDKDRPAKLDLDDRGDEVSAAVATQALQDISRGYTEEEEHWAWCIRNPDSELPPRCGPKVALGDAVIALTTNAAAREGKRIEFKKEWFDPASDETPEGEKPDLSRYA
ncbi:MAG TPA: hypothetical protein EYH34_02280 [Planctomycetes bacterium]|nr:hypothetical protein [Planctomycetota bacterium]